MVPGSQFPRLLEVLNDKSNESTFCYNICFCLPKSLQRRKIKECLVICNNPFSITTVLMMIWLLLESTKDGG